jgi:hypothetical protein
MVLGRFEAKPSEPIQADFVFIVYVVCNHIVTISQQGDARSAQAKISQWLLLNEVG